MGLESQVISVVEVLVSNIPIFVNTPSHVLGGGIWLETCLGLCLHVRQFWILQPVEMECVSAEVCLRFPNHSVWTVHSQQGRCCFFVKSVASRSTWCTFGHLKSAKMECGALFLCIFDILFFLLFAANHCWSSILESIYTFCYLPNFPTGSMDDSWPSQSLNMMAARWRFCS